MEERGKLFLQSKLYVIIEIKGQANSTHFGTVSPVSMFSIIQLLFIQTTKPLYLHSLDLGCKELGV